MSGERTMVTGIVVLAVGSVAVSGTLMGLGIWALWVYIHAPC